MATRAFSGFGKQLNRVEGRQVVRHDLNALPFASVGHVPTKPAGGARPILESMVVDAMRLMRDSASGLTSKEHDRIKQFTRGQYLTGVLSLVEIGQKCSDLAAATAFPEALRGFQVLTHPVAKPQVMEAFHSETDANGAFDLAQLEYAAFPSKVNRDRAIEAGNRQLAETLRSLNALYAAQPKS